MSKDREIPGSPSPTQQDVEQQLRQFLDRSSPGFWLSDRVWSTFEDARSFGLLAAFLLEGKIQLRKLAQKYERTPQDFAAAMARLLKRRAQKLGIPWATHAASPVSTKPSKRAFAPASPRGRGFDTSTPESFFNTSTPDLTVSERKTVGEFFSALSSGSPGRKRASTTNEILRTAGEARALNQKLTLGGIATRVFPDYLQLAGDQRMFRRQMVSRVLKRHGFSDVLSRHQ